MVTPFKIRDKREPKHFWADNELVDNFLPEIGLHGFAVYMLLSRYSNSGTCDPSVAKITKALGIGESTVKVAIKTLVKFNLLKVSHRAPSIKGELNKTNIYELNDIKNLVKQESGSQDAVGGGSHGDPGVGHMATPNNTNTQEDSFSDEPAVVGTKTLAHLNALLAEEAQAQSAAPAPTPAATETPAPTGKPKEEPEPPHLGSPPPLPKKDKLRDPLFDSIAKLQFGVQDVTQMPTITNKKGQTKSLYGGRIGAIEAVIVQGYKQRRQIEKMTPDDYVILAGHHANFWKWYTTVKYPVKGNEKPSELRDNQKFAEYWEEYRGVVTAQLPKREHAEGDHWSVDGIEYRLHNGQIEQWVEINSRWEVQHDGR